MPQMQDKQLRRKETPTKQTPEREEMANVIEEMWPANLSSMADKAGYSRQHAKNTLNSHFEVIKDEPKTPRSITIPEDVTNESDYLQGWLHGQRSQ